MEAEALWMDSYTRAGSNNLSGLQPGIEVIGLLRLSTGVSNRERTRHSNVSMDES